MVQTNVIAAVLKKLLVIEEALDLNVFLGIIYTMVFKLLVAMSITVWILDSGVTRHISDD